MEMSILAPYYYHCSPPRALLSPSNSFHNPNAVVSDDMSLQTSQRSSNCRSAALAPFITVH